MFHSSVCQVQTDPFWHGGKHTLLSEVSKLVLTFRPLTGFPVRLCLFVYLFWFCYSVIRFLNFTEIVLNDGQASDGYRF